MAYLTVPRHLGLIVLLATSPLSGQNEEPTQPPNVFVLLHENNLDGAIAALEGEFDAAVRASEAWKLVHIGTLLFDLGDIRGRPELAREWLARVAALPLARAEPQLATWVRRREEHLVRLANLSEEDRRRCTAAFSELPLRETEDEYSERLAESLPLLRQNLGDDDPWCKIAEHHAARAAHAASDLETACTLLAPGVRWWPREYESPRWWRLGNGSSNIWQTWIIERSAQHNLKARLAAAQVDAPTVATSALRTYRDTDRPGDNIESALLRQWAARARELAEDVGASAEPNVQHAAEEAVRAQLVTEARERWADTITSATRVFGATHEATEACHVLAGFDLARRGHLEAASDHLRSVRAPRRAAQDARQLLQHALDGTQKRDDVADWFELFHILSTLEHKDQLHDEDALGAFEALSDRVLPANSSLRGFAPYCRAMDLARGQRIAEGRAVPTQDWSTSPNDWSSMATHLDAALALLPADDLAYWRSHLVRAEIAKTVGDEVTVKRLWLTSLEPPASRDFRPADLENLQDFVEKAASHAGTALRDAEELREAAHLGLETTPRKEAEALAEALTIVAEAVRRVDAAPNDYQVACAGELSDCVSRTWSIAIRAVIAEAWEVADTALQLLLQAVPASSPGRARQELAVAADREILRDPSRRQRLRMALEAPGADVLAELFGKDSTIWASAEARAELAEFVDLLAELFGKDSTTWASARARAVLAEFSARRFLGDTPSTDPIVDAAAVRELRKALCEAADVLCRGPERATPTNSMLIESDSRLFDHDDLEAAGVLFGIDIHGADPGESLDRESRRCLAQILAASLRDEEFESAPRRGLATGQTLLASLAIEAWSERGMRQLRERSGSLGASNVLGAAWECARVLRLLGRHDEARALLERCAEDRRVVPDTDLMALRYDTALGAVAFFLDDRTAARPLLERVVRGMRVASLDAYYGTWLMELELAWLDLAEAQPSAAADRLGELALDVPPVISGMGGLAIRQAFLALSTVPALQPYAKTCDALRGATVNLPTTRVDWIVGPGSPTAKDLPSSDVDNPLQRARHNLALAHHCSDYRDLYFDAMRWWGIKRTEMQAMEMTGFDVRAQIERLVRIRPLLDNLLASTNLAGVGNDPQEIRAAYENALQWKGYVTSREQLLRALLRDWLRRGGRLRLVTQFVTQFVTQYKPYDMEMVAEKVDAFIREFRTLEIPGFGDINLIERDMLTGRVEEQSVKAWELYKECTPDEVAAQMPSGTAFVDFIEYTGWNLVEAGALRREPMLAAFVTTGPADAAADAERPGLVLVDFGPSREIRQLVHAFRAKTAKDATRGSKTGPDIEDDVDAGIRLRDLLWTPLATAIGPARRVLVCPDGPIAFLPLAALPGNQPGRYLIEDYAFAVVQAPALLLGKSLRQILDLVGTKNMKFGNLLVPTTAPEATSPASPPPPDCALLVGGVAFAAGSHPSLPGTEKEIEEIALRLRQHGVEVETVRGDEATPARVRELLIKGGFVHLATHGASVGTPFNTDSRSDHASYLVLAPGSKSPTDAPVDHTRLDAASIADLDLDHVRIAVLSACETGLGEQAGGEGLLGLQRAFQLAGAQSVVGSLWKVPDAATQQLMVRFYENLLARKMDRIDALREAQLWMLGGGAGGTARQPPWAWAAWQLSGEWR